MEVIWYHSERILSTSLFRSTLLIFLFLLYLYSHGFSLYLLSGGKKHVKAVSDPVPGLSSGRSGDPSAGSADQGERPGAHRCRGTHVHEQPGNPHQVPRFKVRSVPASSIAADLNVLIHSLSIFFFKSTLRNMSKLKSSLICLLLLLFKMWHSCAFIPV